MNRRPYVPMFLVVLVSAFGGTAPGPAAAHPPGEIPETPTQPTASQPAAAPQTAPQAVAAQQPAAVVATQAAPATTEPTPATNAAAVAPQAAAPTTTAPSATPASTNTAAPTAPVAAATNQPAPSSANTPMNPGPKDPAKRVKALDKRGKPFDYEGADLAETLYTFGHAYRFTIVLDPDVVGKITCESDGGTVRDQLDKLTEAGGVFYEEEGKDLVRVKKSETVTYYIEYPTTIRSSSATTSISVSGNSGNSGYGGNQFNNTGMANTAINPLASGGNAMMGGGGGSMNENTFQITKENKGDIWTDIEKEIGAGMDKGEKIVFEDRHAGIMKIYATRERQDEFKNTIDDLNNRLNQSVDISVEIFEVQLNDAYNIGVDWQKVADSVGSSIPGLEGLSVNTNTGQVATNLTPGTQSLAAVVKIDRVYALAQAFHQQGDVRSRSNPKISTLTNQTAFVTVGTTEPFFGLSRQTNIVSPTQTASTNVVSDTTYTDETDTFGAILEVTPTVYRSGLITMDVQPVITALEGEKTSPDGKQTQPRTAIKQAATMLQMYDGETKVLGGFIFDSKSKSRNGVPVLDRIPVLRDVFSTHVTGSQHTEVIICITANITKKRGPV